VKKFHLRRIPYSFDDAQNAERVSLSIDLLRILKENQKTGFANAITCDESWFYFEYLHQSVEVASRDEVPERIKQKIDMEKCLLSTIWSANGIHSLLDVPKGTTYNTTFFCNAFIPGFHDNI
jgi:hypothetical protein